MTRPTWDERWMRAAYLASGMSTCASGRQVGAVAVVDGCQVADGFNGVPRKHPHPEICLRRLEGVPSGVDPHRCGCVHAESNVIANAARTGAILKGASLYVTCQPCRACMGLLANAGIVEIIYDGDYPDPEAVAIAERVGIRLRGIAPSD